MLQKLQNGMKLNERELTDVEELPTNYLICVLNDIPNAFLKLKESKPFLKQLDNKISYIKYKEAVRVLRKVNY